MPGLFAICPDKLSRRDAAGEGWQVEAARPSLTEDLAVRLARPVPVATRAAARLHLLDWLGCVAGARREPVAAVARAAEPDPFTRAALMGNVLEMDDVDRQGRLHPGPVLWPVALSAVRDEAGRGGAARMADLLDGGVRGYEAMISIGRMFDDHHYALWHPTATAGGFGAAAAAASVFGLTPAETVAALGNAGSVAGGLWRMRHEPVMTKALHAAHAGLSALWFARLARQGFTGPARILEGEQGVFAAMTRAPRAVADSAGWRLHEISFKPYPACRHAHPAIDAALQLGAALGGDAPIRVETYGDALRFCDKPHPVSAIEAKFSLQHAVAVVAAKGVPQLADFEPAALADFATARARVSVGIAADLDAAYPAHFGARIFVGEWVALAADALGDPECPVSRADLVAKLTALVAWGGLPAGEAERAVALVLDSDDDAPAAPLFDLVTRWTA
ncbi:MAG: MmgE/PrpD family protein [Alphaproteobacteria bacterium PA4]|nr:MAG: MmgE/PrpD family protein [Alphaproteobacteria bacterium PA4]